VRRRNPDVSPLVEAALVRGLAKPRAGRFQSMRELAVAISPAGLPPETVQMPVVSVPEAVAPLRPTMPLPSPVFVGEPVARTGAATLRRRPVVAAGMLAVGAGAGLVFLGRLLGRSQPPAGAGAASPAPKPAGAPAAPPVNVEGARRPRAPRSPFLPERPRTPEPAPAVRTPEPAPAVRPATPPELPAVTPGAPGRQQPATPPPAAAAAAPGRPRTRTQTTPTRKQAPPGAGGARKTQLW
jgi:hypothetical protein